MRKISKALNKIAEALEGIANSSDKKEEPVYTPINSMRNHTPTVTSTGYQGQTTYFAQKGSYYYEQDIIVDRIYRALTDKGINPTHHDAMMNELKRDWPTLHKELMFLVSYKKRLILEKNDKLQ